jgi:hypothetical protein
MFFSGNFPSAALHQQSDGWRSHSVAGLSNLSSKPTHRLAGCLPRQARGIQNRYNIQHARLPDQLLLHVCLILLSLDGYGVPDDLGERNK